MPLKICLVGDIYNIKEQTSGKGSQQFVGGGETKDPASNTVAGRGRKIVSLPVQRKLTKQVYHGNSFLSIRKIMKKVKS
jgi:hypothetical protein